MDARQNCERVFKIFQRSINGKYRETLSKKLTFQEASKVFVVVPDNKTLVVQSSFGSLEAWNLQTKQLIWQRNNGTGDSSLVATRDGKHLLAAIGIQPNPLLKRGIGFYECRTGKLKHLLFNDERLSTVALALSPDGNLLAQLTWQATLQIWDLSKRKVIASVDNPYYPNAHSFCFTADGKRLLFNTNKGIEAWNVADIVR